MVQVSPLRGLHVQGGGLQLTGVVPDVLSHHLQIINQFNAFFFQFDLRFGVHRQQTSG